MDRGAFDSVPFSGTMLVGSAAWSEHAQGQIARGLVKDWDQ
jgi:hypothetical protein